jgi:hypothetical protein
LQTRYGPARPRKLAKPSRLAKEAFIGMWRNRTDLRDSSAWVRKVRAVEWREP